LELSDDLRVSGGYTYMKAKRLGSGRAGRFWSEGCLPKSRGWGLLRCTDAAVDDDGP